MRLSIIMPWYKKLEDFKRVFQLNEEFFKNHLLEIVIAMDDDSDLGGLMKFFDLEVDRMINRPRFRVIVNRKKHEWRPPCKAINVGIRHAIGENILIVSPESAFLEDVPARMLDSIDFFGPDVAICGRLNCATFEQAEAGLFAAMLKFQRDEDLHFYGSICVSRQNAENVFGFDETLTTWGGDDDNFRARLLLSAVTVVRSSDINVVHLSDQPVDFKNRKVKSQEELDYLRSPMTKGWKGSENWGRDFGEVVYDWKKR